MGDQQIGQSELFLQIREKVDHLGLDTDVERADRLVGDDQIGLGRQGSGDPDPLALATGELVRIAPERSVRQSDGVEQLPHPDADGGSGAQLVSADRLGDDALDALARVEAGIRVLEDHLHVAALLAELFTLERRQLDAVEADGPGGDRQEPQDRLADGALAASTLTDEPERCTVGDVEIDAVDRADGSDDAIEQDAFGDREIYGETADLKHRPPVPTSTRRPAPG